MNKQYTPCKRCSHHVPNDICINCGTHTNGYQCYCDMCSSLVYSADIYQHDCGEKEVGVCLSTYINPERVPRRAKMPLGFKCATCNKTVTTADSMHNCFTESAVIVCTKCRQSMPYGMIYSHNCVYSCAKCHKELNTTKASGHVCGPNSYCQLCGEICGRVHNCKSLPFGLAGLCVHCDQDITSDYITHKCNIGDDYIMIRCANCAVVKTALMMRYHMCKQVGLVKCSVCDLQIPYSTVLQHMQEKHASSGAKDVFVMCACENLVPYLKMRMHREKCSNNFVQPSYQWPRETYNDTYHSYVSVSPPTPPICRRKRKQFTCSICNHSISHKRDRYLKHGCVRELDFRMKCAICKEVIPPRNAPDHICCQKAYSSDDESMTDENFDSCSFTCTTCNKYLSTTAAVTHEYVCDGARIFCNRCNVLVPTDDLSQHFISCTPDAENDYGTMFL